ncbi:MAG: hypothetical protein J5756_07515, partial [Clostridia bacterium]|nr:hypothetical protein [Clostridia bacterium]
MKKLLSFMLAMMFALTAFGVATVFSGFIGAGALYDYYVYDKLPGYSIFTDAELEHMTNLFSAPGYNETIEGVGPVVTYEFSKGNEWRNLTIYNGQGRNLKAASNTEKKDFTDMTWASIDTVGFKTFLGDIRSPDYKTLEDQDGIAFCIYVNGQPFTGTASVTLMQYPTTGPYFTMTLDDDTGDHTAEELADYGIGFRYASKDARPDENGYVHYDFKTDFRQSDWWSSDDEGVNMWKKYKDNGMDIPYMPLPEKVIPKISGLCISFHGLSIGDKVSIGDMMAYHDSRVHTDELEELMLQYDVLDPEAFTESSYEAATEIYLEAYDIMSDPEVGEHYSQKQINTVAKELKAALKALQPMFKVKSTSVSINGFDSLTDDDIDLINDGGASLDPAMITDEFVPEGDAKQSIYVIGGAFDGDPSYGWSLFTTSILNDDDEVEAVGNVFGAENLEESAGIRFWIKYGDSYTPAPTDMTVGVGSSADGVFFECDPDAAVLPESEGYVGVAWNAFYDMYGDEEIYDYLASLDYITIRIEGCYQKEYYLSDLHAFEWGINSANFAAMDQQIIDAQNYLATLNKDDWSVRSWQRAEQSIEAARALHEAYAVTQQEVDKAADFITRCLNWLTLRGQTPTQEEIDALEAAYYNALTYWRGNYTGRSYVALKAEIDEVGEYINDELSSVACVELTNKLNAAVAGLVPITHGGTVAPTPATDYTGKAVNVKLFSLEDFSSNREFNKAMGHRVANVGYDLVTSSTSVDLPAKALKMTAQADLSSKHTDQHGAMQFKLADKICDPIHPDVTTEDGNEIGGSIGDLKGSAGIRVWVGVNDYNLAKDAYFRFGVSNCQEGPLFEKHAVNIPFPAAGSGWLYIPWECFDYYDDWTGGQDINLTEIRFIILRVDGEVPQGLEVYATCVSAYTDPANSENAAPVISGVSEGQTVDVAGEAVAPKWDVGTATLNGKRYLAGTPIDKNDDYTLVVTNGDKQTSVNFTVTGGITADSIPVVVGVVEGGEYDEPVTITWDVGEATLNGEPIEKGAAVSEPGNYMLQVINGTKSVAIRFKIAADAEDEQPVISGVENGGEYDAPAAATWTPAEATATLNGEAYVAGTEITAPGEYVLVVTNGDKSATVSFTVKDQTPPPPEYKRGDMDGDN